MCIHMDTYIMYMCVYVYTYMYVYEYMLYMYKDTAASRHSGRQDEAPGHPSHSEKAASSRVARLV